MVLSINSIYNKAINSTSSAYTVDVSDYEDMSYVLYFSAMHTRDCLQVAIVDDSRYEVKETFRYALDLYSENLPHVEIEPAFVWIEILNDDGEIPQTLTL